MNILVTVLLCLQEILFSFNSAFIQCILALHFAFKYWQVVHMGQCCILYPNPQQTWFTVHNFSIRPLSSPPPPLLKAVENNTNLLKLGRGANLHVLICTSIVDPNTLHLHLDPEFWSKLVPDPGLFDYFWEKKIIQTNFREKLFLYNKFFFIKL